MKAEQDNLAKVMADAGGEELIKAEKHLAEAEQAYLVAQKTLDQARLATDRTDLEDYAQQLFDACRGTP